MSYVIGYITFKNQLEAKKICSQLISEKLIACANILPAHTALYRWKSKNVKAKETAAIIKTQSHLQKKVARRIKQLHSYEVPCVVFWKFSTPIKDFTNWIAQQTKL